VLRRWRVVHHAEIGKNAPLNQYQSPLVPLHNPCYSSSSLLLVWDWKSCDCGHVVCLPTYMQAIVTIRSLFHRSCEECYKRISRPVCKSSNPHRGDERVITTTVDNQRKIMSTLLLQPETTYLQDYWVLFQLFGW
jgi:hypothetical protein